MKVEIKSVKNGYVVTTADITGLGNSEYIFRSVDILPMLEFVGTLINDRKVKVVER